MCWRCANYPESTICVSSGVGDTSEVWNGSTRVDVLDMDIAASAPWITLSTRTLQSDAGGPPAAARPLGMVIQDPTARRVARVAVAATPSLDVMHGGALDHAALAISKQDTDSSAA